MAYVKLEDENGRIVRVPVFNESEDGSGTWHVPVCDTSGYLKVALQSIQIDFVPAADDTYDIGSSILEWKDLYIDGVAYIDALTMHGDITLGAYALKTTNLLFSERSANQFQIRNVGNTAYKDLYLGTLLLNEDVLIAVTGKGIKTANTDDFYATFKARDSGVGLVEVARLAGAADPYFSMGGSQEFKFYESGIAYFGGLLFMGDSNITAEAVMGITTGIQIDQGAADDAVLVFKSSDVAHGGTGLADTDTFAYFKKVASTSGGLLIRTYKDAADGNNSAFLMESYLAENVDTTKSTAGRAIIEFKGAQITGTAQANVVADGNVFAIRGRIGGADTSLAIFDEDGDLWLNGGLDINEARVGGDPATDGYFLIKLAGVSYKVPCLAA